ncbi:MAG: hypothetical protein WCT26_03760 [Candidatus Buchananbacteria bacterium]|jgi:hypothetical protein
MSVRQEIRDIYEEADYVTDEETAQALLDWELYGSSAIRAITPRCYREHNVTCPWEKTQFCDRYDIYWCMCAYDNGTPEGGWSGPVIKDWGDEVEEFEYWQGKREEKGKDVWGDPEMNEYDYANAAEAEEISEWNQEMDRLVAIERENEKRARRRHSTKAANNRLKKLGWRYEADDEAKKWEEVSVRRKTSKALRDRHFYEHTDISANTRLKYDKDGVSDQQAIDESTNSAFENDYEQRFWWMEYSPAKRRRVTKVMRDQKMRQRLRGLKQYRSLLTLQHCFGDDHDCVLDNYRRNVRKIVTVSAKISRS